MQRLRCTVVCNTGHNEIYSCSTISIKIKKRNHRVDVIYQTNTVTIKSLTDVSVVNEASERSTIMVYKPFCKKIEINK